MNVLASGTVDDLRWIYATGHIISIIVQPVAAAMLCYVALVARKTYTVIREAKRLNGGHGICRYPVEVPEKK